MKGQREGAGGVVVGGVGSSTGNSECGSEGPGLGGGGRRGSREPGSEARRRVSGEHRLVSSGGGKE